MPEINRLKGINVASVAQYNGHVICEFANTITVGKSHFSTLTNTEVPHML